MQDFLCAPLRPLSSVVRCSKKSDIRNSCGYVTVIVIVLLVPPHKLAETVVLPADTGVPVPPLMVRIEVLPTFQVTSEVTSVWVLTPWKVASAVKAMDCPVLTVVGVAEIVIVLTTGQTVTVALEVLLIAPTEADTVVVPGGFGMFARLVAVIWPITVLLNDATLEFEEDHDALLVTSFVLPSL